MIAPVILRPERGEQEHRADGHGGVRDVEYRPANVAESEIEKIDHSLRGADPVYDITDRPASDRTDGEQPETIRCGRVQEHQPENGERDES